MAWTSEMFTYMYVYSLKCNCKYAPKTFNQGRGSLRKFPSVKYLLIADGYNEVNENNTLIIDSCHCGSIIATLFRLDFCSDKHKFRS